MGQQKPPTGTRNSPAIIEAIRAAMNEKRHNASSLAAALNKSRQWGYAVMSNEILLSADMLVEIARVLDIRLDSIFPVGEKESKKETLEQYIRRVCQEEISKLQQ